jgi:Na+-driven multidrug efflux pump
MGKYALLFALLRKVVLEIPLLFVLNHFFPLYGIAYAQFLTEVVLTVAAVIMLIRIFRQCNGTTVIETTTAQNREAL